VFGSAKGNLLPLVSGAKRFDIDLQLHATTTIQGGGDLEWKTRPGRYTEAGTILIMEAQTLHAIVNPDLAPLSSPKPTGVPAEGSTAAALKKSTLTTDYNHISRAIFILHYHDTSLLLKLQSILRSTNSKNLSLEGSSEHILRTLKTYKLQRQQLDDMSLDILTGFQLIDSAQRIILLEGVADGHAMQLVREIATQALANDPDPLASAGQTVGAGAPGAAAPSVLDAAHGTPERRDSSSGGTAAVDTGGRSGDHGVPSEYARKILINLDIRYPCRLYGSMVGADLWPLKLRSNLLKINKDPVMCGKRVRPSCVEGLRRLSSMSLCTWMREIDRMDLWPSEDMLKVVDKKFGGEMTKSDLGETEMDGATDSGALYVHGGHKIQTKSGAGTKSVSTIDAVMKAFDSIVVENETKQDGSRDVSCESEGGPEKEADSSRGKEGDAKRDASQRLASSMLDGGPLSTLMQNPEYERVKAQRALERSRRDFKEEQEALIRSLGPRAETIRENWREWNPVRVSIDRADELERTAATPASIEGAANAERDAPGDGYGMHADPFRWPPARRASEYVRHPKRPTDARIEELRSPWLENEYNNTSANNTGSVGRNAAPSVPFHTNVVRGSGQLFERDPKYFTSVHLCGDGLIREQMEARQHEEEEFNAKVVVDDIHFKSVIKSRAKPSQTDRHQSLLNDSPVKKGLRPANKLDVPPISMRITLPHEEADKTILQRKDDRNRFKGDGDFRRHIKSNVSKVHKR